MNWNSKTKMFEDAIYNDQQKFKKLQALLSKYTDNASDSTKEPMEVDIDSLRLNSNEKTGQNKTKLNIINNKALQRKLYMNKSKKGSFSNRITNYQKINSTSQNYKNDGDSETNIANEKKEKLYTSTSQSFNSKKFKPSSRK